jgi:lysophospholipase L1-like esterase
MARPNGPVVYNLGVRGDGLERLASRLVDEVGRRGELRRQIPQGILIGIGHNDAARVGRADGRQQLDPEGFLFGLKQLLATAKALTPIHVLGLAPVDEAAMPYAEVLWYQLDDIRRYEALVEEACLEADVPFLPLLNGLLADPNWRQLLCRDGLHLNTEGHHQVFERIRHWPALLQWADLDPGSTASHPVP